jgi:hypothetical protein
VAVNGSVVPGFANATFGTNECQNVTATSITAAGGLDAAVVYDLRIFKSSEAQWAATVPEPNWLTLVAVVLDGAAAASAPGTGLAVATTGGAPQLLESPPWRPERRKNTNNPCIRRCL